MNLGTGRRKKESGADLAEATGFTKYHYIYTLCIDDK